MFYKIFRLLLIKYDIRFTFVGGIIPRPYPDILVKMCLFEFVSLFNYLKQTANSISSS